MAAGDGPIKGRTRPEALRIGRGRQALADGYTQGAEHKTGLLAGGISPLALLRKPFSIYLDRHAIQWETIWVSAGQRGYNLRIGVTDLIAVTGAQVIDAVGHLEPDYG
jgi:Cys-tRNA(Pro)/Cys-tRNA(Cys) deacylase